MRLFRRVILPAAILSACSLALLPGAARAQEMILEAEPGTDSLAYCDSLHNTKTCGSLHIETQVALSVGATVKLNGELYVVSWMGPGYYLETGLVVEPTGLLKADLKGQSWVEVKPREGRAHTSRGWRDAGDRGRGATPGPGGGQAAAGAGADGRDDVRGPVQPRWVAAGGGRGGQRHQGV